MRASEAKRLRNGDEVEIKATGGYATVYRAYPCEGDPRTIIVEVFTGGGIETLTHRDIR